MNILLIYPEFQDTFWSFKYALEFVGKRAVLPPAGTPDRGIHAAARWDS